MKNGIKWAYAATLLLIAIGLGCDRTQPKKNVTAEQGSAMPSFVSTGVSADAVLNECMSAYRRLSSYEDAAYVSLSYELDGVPHSDRAPVSVAWEKNGLLGLKVYSVVAGPSNNRWRLRVDRQDLAPVSQVLSRAVPGSLDFQWLLADPVVSQSLSAGLAGFPPQLDLLISPTALEGLLGPESHVEIQKPAMLGDRGCHVIAIETRGLNYRLFIDKASMMLRKLELPNQNLPPEILTDDRIQKLQLSVEVDKIRTNKPIEWGHYEVSVGPSDSLVNHFVPQPALNVNPAIGARVPAFEAFDAAGNPVLRKEADGKNVTVLVWLANHESCRVAAQQIVKEMETVQLDPAIANRVNLQLLWAEPSPPEGLSFKSLVKQWNLPGKLALDRDALGRDFFMVDEAPCVVVLDQNNRIQLHQSGYQPELAASLPALLSRICSGENVAKSQLATKREIERRFQSELRRAYSIDHVRNQATVSLTSYAPELVSLEPLKSVDFASPAVAVAAATEERIWSLHQSGVLRLYDPSSAETIAKWSPDWELAGGGVLFADDSGRFVAYATSNSKVVNIFDIDRKRNQRIELRIDAIPSGFSWIKLEQPTSTETCSNYWKARIDPD